MEHSLRKARLLTLLRQSHQAEQEWISATSEAERKAHGTSEDWSAKDLLLHLTFWKERRGRILSLLKKGETPSPLENSLDEMNAQTFATSQQQTFGEIQARAEYAFTTLVAQTEALTEEELSDPERFAWLQGDALWWSILSAGVQHPSRHLAEWYLHHGDDARGAALQEQVNEAMAQMQFSEEDMG